MIKKEGDYYVYQPSPQQLKQFDARASAQKPKQTFETVGDARQRIKIIRERFEVLKKAKKAAVQTQAKSQTIFDRLTPDQTIEEKIVQIQMSIPEQLLRLEGRVSKIKQMVRANQLSKQKIEKRANLCQRIRNLLNKFKTVQATSSQIIIKNIQSYANYIDDQSELLKIVFLYQAFTKIQGLDQQISVIGQYLKKLNMLQTKLNSSIQIDALIKDHNEVLKKRQQLSKKIHQLFNSMKKQYEDMIEQIQKLSK